MARSKTKYTKYAVLRREPSLHPALPETLPLALANMSRLLGKYSKVVAKPSTGSRGAGVIMVSSQGHNRYSVHYGRVRHTCKGLNRTYTHVRSKVKRSYIVQRGISLATVNGRPFDIRVMVQRRIGGNWVITGMLAKVAGPGYIVTNIGRSKGKVLPLRTAIRLSSACRLSQAAIIRRIRSVALRAARRLATYYTSQRVFGLDMGIDSSGRVWIIEANLTPDITLFLKMRDKRIYRTILAYRRQNRNRKR
ncbi:YheC/YheD family protein [Brevibacillus sp. H7]|uniref:YheC/YheD family protein n=1 Tax=Brevibacillus sp. H7 TaxID=3349138 RepID=UPI0038192FE6